MAKEPTTLDDLFNEYEAEKAAEPLPPPRVISEEEQAQIDAYWDTPIVDEVEDEDEEDDNDD